MQEINQPRLTRESVTDLYLITVLCIFPLFFGFSGYTDITLSKYIFWLAATGLWLAALGVLSLAGGSPSDSASARGPSAARAAAWGFLAVCLISWLASPLRREGFLGAGRYDGLLTLSSYVLCFLGLARFARPRAIHAAAFAVGVGVCCCVGVLHLFGKDPLGLFPGTLNYYDAGTLYSGRYLGTIGNTNIQDAVLCVSLPLFYALYVCGIGGGRCGLFLLPLLPGCFVLLRSGGSGAAVALCACALALPPVLITGPARLRRALRGLSLMLVPAAAALAFAPEYADRSLSVRFALTPSGAAALGAGAVLFALSALPFRRLHPDRRMLRRAFLVLDAAILSGAWALVFFWPGTGGALYELRNALHGHLEDSYGSSRIRIWRECLRLVPEHPLLGGGPGTLALRVHIDFSRFVPETGRTLRSTVDNAHNIYLGYLVNCGILGLGAYLALLLISLAGAVKRGGALALCLALAVFCAAIHGLFGLGLFLSEPIFWAVLGLLCASGRDTRCSIACDGQRRQRHEKQDEAECSDAPRKQVGQHLRGDSGGCRDCRNRAAAEPSAGAGGAARAGGDRGH